MLTQHRRIAIICIALYWLSHVEKSKNAKAVRYCTNEIHLLLYNYDYFNTNPIKQYKIDRVNCVSDFCTSVYCKVVRKSSRLQVMDGGCTLSARVNAVTVRLLLLYRYQTTYRTFLYDMTQDVCVNDISGWA